jgi:hypothetical protein
LFAAMNDARPPRVAGEEGRCLLEDRGLVDQRLGTEDRESASPTSRGIDAEPATQAPHPPRDHAL